MTKNIKWFVLIIMLYFLMPFSFKSSQASQVNDILKYSHNDVNQRINMDALRFLGLDEVLGTNWLDLPSLNISRGIPASVGTDDFIYGLGGRSGFDFESSVELAYTNLDGSIESWQFTSPMIIKRGAAAAVIAEDRIYVFGGAALDSPGGDVALSSVEHVDVHSPGGDVALSSVEHVDVHSDGSLGNWNSSISMNESRVSAAAVTDGKRIYVIGGHNGIPPNFDSVEFATIKADGSLDTWQFTSSMNTPRSGATAVVFGDNIYIIGGNYPLAGYQCLETVERATINEDGSLSDWEYMTSLNQGRHRVASVLLDEYIYALGGISCSGVSDTVERARIKPDGTLDNWEIVITMSRPRGCLSAVANTRNRHIYVIGGEADCAGKSVEAIPVDAPLSYGLTINDGELFTNQISVTLSISAPYTTVEMQVCNDGGFAGVLWEPYEANKDWSITQYGSYVIPRVVYVRFKDISGNISTIYQDDVILDVNAPTGAVEITGTISGVMGADSSHPMTVHSTPTNALTNTIYLPLVANNARPGFTLVGLLLSATDDVSGVGEMLISNDADFADAQWEAYATEKNWWIPEMGTTTVYVKFRDRAGNESLVYSDTVTP